MTQAVVTPDELDELHAACASLRTGLTLLTDNMYRRLHSVAEQPKTPPGDGRRAWFDVLQEFRKAPMASVDKIDTFLRRHRGEPVTAHIETAISQVGTWTSWKDIFTGNGGVVPTGNNIVENCPAMHQIRFDCVSGPTRLTGLIDKVQKVVASLDKIEGLPDAGYAQVRVMSDPKITIMGTPAVSEAAMDVVKHVYTEILGRLTPAYPRSTMDGYKVYIVNGEPWPDLQKIQPVGSTDGEERRGGANGDFLWLDEQMICKIGVVTRNQAFDQKKRTARDDDDRTYDQVIHELGHALAFRYGLDTQIANVFKNSHNPVEQFPASVQYWFGAPDQSMPADEQAFITGLFGTTRTTFSRDLYKP